MWEKSSAPGEPSGTVLAVVRREGIPDIISNADGGTGEVAGVAEAVWVANVEERKADCGLGTGTAGTELAIAGCKPTGTIIESPGGTPVVNGEPAAV